MIAKTFFGLEAELAKELRAIGATDIEEISRAVSFKGNLEVMYKANYLCYTALRILKPIKTFEVRDENELYQKVKEIKWWDYMEVDQTLAINAVVNHSKITHSQYASLKTKDAIADGFREKFRRRPSVDLDNPDLRINVHIHKDSCTLSLDSSGSSLHKRGYRSIVDKAPLNEVLAAGLLKLSDWNGQTNFYDPMSGSGTLLIEAAMQARNIPAGNYRTEFGFMGWKDYDEELWNKIVKEASNNIREFDHKIIGTDQSMKAVNFAKRNVRSARFEKYISIQRSRMQNFELPISEGLLVTNPPYGERLEEDDIIELYKMMGDQFKQKFQGFNAWIFSGNMDALKFVGLRPSRKIHMYNGAIECRFAKFEIYKGSKKQSKQQPN
ncbi:MAG: RNA methyltransferase [Bacteroidetes bacterium]|nr:RNA methyltransferase [Bacteroidota bacterium]